MKDILNSHPVGVLKKEISKTNIKGYSKLKKAELVSLMVKHKARFSHIKMADKKKIIRKPVASKPVASKPVAPPKKKKIIKNKPIKGTTRYIEYNFFGDNIKSFVTTGDDSEQYNRIVNRLMTPARQAGMKIKKRKELKDELENVAWEAIWGDGYKNMEEFLKAIGTTASKSYEKELRKYYTDEMEQMAFASVLDFSPAKPKPKSPAKKEEEKEEETALEKEYKGKEITITGKAAGGVDDIYITGSKKNKKIIIVAVWDDEGVDINFADGGYDYIGEALLKDIKKTKKGFTIPAKKITNRDTSYWEGSGM